MKHFKRALPLMLAFVMAFSLAVTVQGTTFDYSDATSRPVAGNGASVSYTAKSTPEPSTVDVETLDVLVSDARLHSDGVTGINVTGGSGFTLSNLAGDVSNVPVEVTGGTLTINTTVKSVTVSGSGEVIIGVGGSVTGAVTVSGSGKVTVSGGMLDGAVTVDDSGSVELEGSATVNGPITLTSGSVKVTGGTVYKAVTVNGGKLAISNGTVSGAVTVSGGEVAISGGTVSGAVTVSGGELAISGGTVGGKVTLNNGNATISGTGEVSGGVALKGGKLTVTGGTGAGVEAIAVTGNGGDLAISGGKVTLKGNVNSVSFGGGELTIDEAGNYEVNGSGDGDLIVKQGTVNVFNNFGDITVNGGVLYYGQNGHATSASLTVNKGTVMLYNNEEITGNTNSGTTEIGTVNLSSYDGITATIVGGRVNVIGAGNDNNDLVVQSGDVYASSKFGDVEVTKVGDAIAGHLYWCATRDETGNVKKPNVVTTATAIKLTGGEVTLYQDATIAASSTGGTVTYGASATATVESTAPINVTGSNNGNLTVNNDGKANAAGAFATVTVNEGGKLNWGTADGTNASDDVTTATKLTLKGGKVKLFKDATIAADSTTGTVTYNLPTTEAIARIEGGTAIEVTGSGDKNALIVTGGIVTAMGEFKAPIELSGGTLNMQTNGTVMGGGSDHYGNLTINGTGSQEVNAWAEFATVTVDNANGTLNLGKHMDGNAALTTVHRGLVVTKGAVDAKGTTSEKKVVIKNTTSPIVDIAAGATVTLNEYVEVAGVAEGMTGIENDGTLTMKATGKAPLITLSGANSVGINNAAGATATIKAVTIGMEGYPVGIGITNAGTLKIQAGTTPAETTTAQDATVTVEARGNALKITGGTVTVEGAYKAATFTSTGVGVKALNVTGGDVTLTCGAFSGKAASTFKVDEKELLPEKNYFVDEYDTDDDDDTYNQTVVDAVWAIQYFMGEKDETSPATAAKSEYYDEVNATFKLPCNVYFGDYTVSPTRYGALAEPTTVPELLNSTIEVDAERTLDLDGYTITGANNTTPITASGALVELTVKNSGTKGGTLDGTTGKKYAEGAITATGTADAITLATGGSLLVKGTNADIKILGNGTDKLGVNAGTDACAVTVQNEGGKKVTINGIKTGGAVIVDNKLNGDIETGAITGVGVTVSNDTGLTDGNVTAGLDVGTVVIASINAGTGSVEITNGTSGQVVRCPITVSGTVSGADVTITNNSEGFNGGDAINIGDAITATGNVSITNNANGAVKTAAITAKEAGKILTIDNKANGSITTGAIGGNATGALTVTNNVPGVADNSTPYNGTITIASITRDGTVNITNGKEPAGTTPNTYTGTIQIGAQTGTPPTAYTGTVTGKTVTITNYSNGKKVSDYENCAVLAGDVVSTTGDVTLNNQSTSGMVAIVNAVNATGALEVTNGKTTSVTPNPYNNLVVIGREIIADSVTVYNYSDGKAFAYAPKINEQKLAVLLGDDVVANTGNVTIENNAAGLVRAYNYIKAENGAVNLTNASTGTIQIESNVAPADPTDAITAKIGEIDNQSTGTIVITAKNGNGIAVSTGAGNLRINGATITATDGDGVYFNSTGTLDIDAGTITGTGTGHYGLNIPSTATGNIDLVGSATYNSVKIDIEGGIYKNIKTGAPYNYDWVKVKDGTETHLYRTYGNYLNDEQDGVRTTFNESGYRYKVSAEFTPTASANATVSIVKSQTAKLGLTEKLTFEGGATKTCATPYIVIPDGTYSTIHVALNYDTNVLTATATTGSDAAKDFTDAYGNKKSITVEVKEPATGGYIGGSTGGGGGGGGGTAITATVSGDQNSVSLGASGSGDTATLAKPTAAQLDKVIGASVDTGEVVVDMSSLSKSYTKVAIPADTVKAIEKAVTDTANDADELTIKAPNGEVTFDAAALDTIVDQMKGSDLKLEVSKTAENKLAAAQQSALKDLEVQDVYSITLTSGNTVISDFKDGTATVSVNYKLKSGQSARGIVVWYVANDGTLTEVPSTFASGKVTFRVNHFSNYVIAYDAARAAACPQDSTCPIAAFSDADAKAWYHDGVHWALENGVMSGMGDGTFAPNGTTTRAMVAQILWNLEGKPAYVGMSEYADVDNEDWFGPAVRWASAEGIVTGYANPDGAGMIFKPNDAVTREQLATMLYRYAQYKKVDVSVGEDTNILSYEDAFSVSSWAMSAMQWACGAGVVNGVAENGTMYLQPQNNASRAVVATMIARFCTEVAK